MYLHIEMMYRKQIGIGFQKTSGAEDSVCLSSSSFPCSCPVPSNAVISLAMAMAMAMATPALPSSSSSLFSPSSLRDEGSCSRAQQLLLRIGCRRTRRSCSVIRNVVITHKDEGDLRTSFDADALDVPVHTVTVHDRKTGAVHTVQVPEDQYILHTAEYQDVDLPFSCRHGCCTACAVRVKSGEIYQPRALGISTELKEQGYALLCVGYPLSDLEVETQDEDEVYWLQFGQYFARGPLERDDYALELAVADE